MTDVPSPLDLQLRQGRSKNEDVWIKVIVRYARALVPDGIQHYPQKPDEGGSKKEETSSTGTQTAGDMIPGQPQGGELQSAVKPGESVASGQKEHNPPTRTKTLPRKLVVWNEGSSYDSRVQPNAMPKAPRRPLPAPSYGRCDTAQD